MGRSKLNLFCSAYAGMLVLALFSVKSAMAVEITEERFQQVVEHLDTLDMREAAAQHLEPVIYVVQDSEPPAASALASNAGAPAPRRRFTWWQKLSPLFWLGNADDPTPPDWYDPNGKFRRLKWYLRNPGHNFTFYVLGVADKVNSPNFVRVGKYPKDVFAPVQGWNYAITKIGHVRLPFVSYWDGHVRFYIGWRENGNFGIKLIQGTKKHP